MIISKKRFDQMVQDKVCERLETLEQGRFINERLRENDMRFDAALGSVYSRLERLEREVFGDPHCRCDEPKCPVYR